MEPGLRTYVLKRVGFAVLMLVGVSIILFTIMRLAPGGPEAVLIGGEFSQEAAAQIRQRLGLDRSIALQYLGWAGAAVRRGTIWDTLGSAVALFGVSFPSFWLGIMLILLFSEVLHLLPPSGLSEYGREAELSARVRHAILPTLTLGLIQMASFMRFTRSSLLEVLRQDYVRTARAKGLGGGRVVWRHALRNALIPVVTVVGLALPTLVGGAVLTETVFAWPGIGRLAVGAVFERDYPVIMGVNVMVAAVVIVANLLTDLAYCVIDT